MQLTVHFFHSDPRPCRWSTPVFPSLWDSWMGFSAMRVHFQYGWMSPHHLLVQTPPSHEKLWQILAFRARLPAQTLLCHWWLLHLPRPSQACNEHLSPAPHGTSRTECPPAVTTTNFFTPSFLFFNYEKYPREEFPFWPITTSFFIPPWVSDKGHCQKHFENPNRLYWPDHPCTHIDPFTEH